MAPGGREAVRRRPVPRGVREALLEACASGAMTQTEAAGLAGVDPSAVAHWKRRMSLEGREPVMRDGDAPMDARVELERVRVELERGACRAGAERGPSWPRWPPVWSGTGPRAGSWGSSWRCAGARWSWWEKGGAQTRKT